MFRKKIKVETKPIEQGSVKIKKEESSISEFIERELPSEAEVNKFDEITGASPKNSSPDEVALSGNQQTKADKEEIEESLSEIYHNEKGEAVDVSRLEIKKKRGIIFFLLSSLFMIAILAGAGYGIYNYFFANRSDSTAVTITIEGEDKVMVGEEFDYLVYFKNSTGVNLHNITVEVNYPSNFIFLKSNPQVGKENLNLEPATVEAEAIDTSDADGLTAIVSDSQAVSEEAVENKQIKTSIWQFDAIAPGESKLIKITGKAIDKEGKTSIVLAKILYTPENFSSEFKKEASYNTVVSNTGLNITADYYATALVNQTNQINYLVSTRENSKITDFKLIIEPKDNIEFSVEAPEPNEAMPEADLLKIEALKTNVWKISNLSDKDKDLIINYKVKEKLNDKEAINLKFSLEENFNDYVFYEEAVETEVLKSDLNLTMIINGSKGDQPVDFGDTLNYSIVYNNKGDNSMEDVVIMAVLESDFLDWTSLNDQNNGREKGNTITWTKEEVPALAELGKNAEGMIDFSIKVQNFQESDMDKNYEIKNYAQYTIGNMEEFLGSEDNQSNTVVNKINSDLNLKEEVRYFSEDNIPVGTGPLPPKVGEPTSFKVYWTITNNLHELRNTNVEVILPSYISFDSKERASVGTIKYLPDERKVVWDIGRLPTSVYRADAEFSISLTPTEDDRNKILVLLPGSSAMATDNETGDSISKGTGAKTTKLEDDEVAGVSSDGRVQ